MRNLLSANFSRLWKSRIFWAALLFMAGLSAFVVWNQYDEMTSYGVVVTLDQPLFLSMCVFGIVAAVLVSLFVGTEYSDGTIRNKLTVGGNRTCVYLASCVPCAAALVMAYALAVLLALALGAALFDPPAVSGPTLAAVFGAGLTACFAYAGIYSLIAMLCGSRTYTAIACILLSFGLLAGAVYCSNMLSQTEYVQQLTPVTDSADEETGTTTVFTGDGASGQLALETVPNPSYPTGAKRTLLQLLYDVNPTGQALQFAFLHPVRAALCNAGIVALSCLAGTLAFRRKDIR